MRCSRWRGPIRRRAADEPPAASNSPRTYCASIMSRAVRSTVKRLAQKLLGQSDVRGFVRKHKLWLSKKIYRRPVAIADLRQQLIDLGVTPGRTLWVQSSWNEFYNVPLRPSEMIDLLRDLLGPDGTLAMPAFPIDQNPDKVFLVDRAPVYTGLLCEVFRRTPDMRRSIHLASSVCAVGPNADFLVQGSPSHPDALGQGQPVLPARGTGRADARNRRRLQFHDPSARRGMSALRRGSVLSAGVRRHHQISLETGPMARPASTNSCGGSAISGRNGCAVISARISASMQEYRI